MAEDGSNHDEDGVTGPSTSPGAGRHGIRRVARNVVWNWGGMGVNILAGFLVAPFLVHHLGQTGYGLWILVASLIYYFGLLDMGIRGAVGRQIAFHCAKGDWGQVNATVSTAVLILLGASAIALAGTLAVVAGFFRIFEVPPEMVGQVRIALVVVGAGLAMWLPMSVFEAVLWAYQRFDAINVADIAGATTRTLLILAWLSQGGGLVELALIHSACQLGALVAKVVAVFRIDPHMRVGPRLVSRSAARAVLGIGSWNTLISGSAIVNGQMGPAIVAAQLGVHLVTPYSIAARLMAYGRDFLVASTGVLTPVAVGLHAGNEHDAQSRLFFKGGKYCLAMSLYFLTLFLLLGRPMISLWIGPGLAWASSLLAIIAVGEALPMSQWVSYSIILGKYRHQALGIAGIVENVTAISLALVLVGPLGLAGVCIGFAIPATLCRGAFQLLYASRLVDAPLRRYLTNVVLPLLAAILLPALLLAAMVRWHPPDTWVLLAGYGAAFSIAYAVSLVALTGYDWIKLGNSASRPDDAPRSLARRVITVFQEAW